MFRVRGTIMALVAGSSILLGTTPARAACAVDLTNAPSGQTDACSDFGFGYNIVGVTGRARYEVFCGGSLVFTGILTSGGLGVGSTNGSVGCSAVLRLTSLQNGTTAYGVMD